MKMKGVVVREDKVFILNYDEYLPGQSLPKRTQKQFACEKIAEKQASALLAAKYPVRVKFQEKIIRVWTNFEGDV